MVSPATSGAGGAVVARRVEVGCIGLSSFRKGSEYLSSFKSAGLFCHAKSLLHYSIAWSTSLKSLTHRWSRDS
jgi:hypothetical protein